MPLGVSRAVAPSQCARGPDSRPAAASSAQRPKNSHLPTRFPPHSVSAIGHAPCRVSALPAPLLPPALLPAADEDPPACGAAPPIASASTAPACPASAAPA